LKPADSSSGRRWLTGWGLGLSLTAVETYELEYGTDSLEIHQDAVQKGQRVLVCDDLLATGGTAAASVRLIRKLGGDVMGCGFAVELTFLHGREKLQDVDVYSLLQYDT
jgi:adenine phosphoribosyltransferase